MMKHPSFEFDRRRFATAPPRFSPTFALIKEIGFEPVLHRRAAVRSCYADVTIV